MVMKIKTYVRVKYKAKDYLLLFNEDHQINVNIRNVRQFVKFLWNKKECCNTYEI